MRVEALVEGAPRSWLAGAMLIAPPRVARQKGAPRHASFPSQTWSRMDAC